MSLRKYILAGAAVLGMVSMTEAVRAEHHDDGQWSITAQELKGKTVAFVPISMGFDLTQAWAAGLQHSADKWGYKLVIRDPNWDIGAGAQALTQLIAEKPDVLIFHSLDFQSYVKLVKKASDAGITTVQIALKTTNNGDAFVGPDWYQVAEEAADTLTKMCDKSSGKSGKVAVVGGEPTNPGMMIAMDAINDSIKKHPGIELVANQAANYDATKAHDLTLTLLKQHEDLCGIFGAWDGQDVGTAAAIKEAGKTGKVMLVTSGGGRKEAACDNIANGSYDAYVSYDGKGMARDLVDTVEALLQNKPEKPGAHPIGIYSPLRVLTKENLTPTSCWTLEDIKANGV